MEKDRKIGVAMDFSKSSKRALDWAISNLSDKGDTLYIIHIKPHSLGESRSSLWSASGSPLIPLVEFREPEVMKKYEVETDMEVLDTLDTASRQKEKSCVKQRKTLSWTLWSWEAEVLAKSRDKNALVLSYIIHWCVCDGCRILLGSVTNYVMTTVLCPVTIVKDPDFRKL
ncbi:hypothetical protein RHGRI_015349 [Rhododendron griersonianum]|uniref:UspA domain-containing protein n=1 Tax=Rhododendron griersonianum TaxID=479676 RepID=A0AAV6KCY0_9ERIC|nr:hypothetical protein RHGRI_015349 [Rhododendron griersonianum]